MQSCLSMVVSRRWDDWYGLAAGKIKFTDDWFVKSHELIDGVCKVA